MKRTSWYAAVTVLLYAPAFGQSSAALEDGDVPEQGVARLSLIQGDVKVRQGDSGEETAGAVNAPLLAGDRVYTSGNSRAELQFDSANLIRIGSMTELRMGELADRRYEIHLINGLAMIRVTRDNQAQFEVDTPSVSVRPTRRGSYRILVQQDGTSEITVRSGEVEIFSPRGSEVLGAGKTMLVRGSASDPEFQVVTEAAEDEFDQWNRGRDQELDRSISSRYVPSDVYGTETLDGYGSWAYDAPYGWVWVPRVDAGWAPYRVGRWSYVNYYGWSWISGDPWGWAPYHYGRWYQGGRGWSWYPGAMGSRYYWRPALVGFFGWGSGGIGIGFGNTWGFGNVGWVPLAPYEVYRPWYGRWGGRGYNNTVINNINITNVYRNARGNNGITSIRSGEFGRGGVNNGNYVRAGDRDLRNAGDVRGGVPLQPGQGSRRFSDRNVANANFPRSDENRQVFRRALAPANPVARSVTGGQNNPGGSNTIGRNVNSGGDNAPIFRGGPVDTPGRGRDNTAASPTRDNSGTAANNRGWRTFDAGADRGAVRGAGQLPATRAIEAPRQDNARSGWRTFDPNTTVNRSTVDRGTVRRSEPASIPSTSQPSVDRVPRSTVFGGGSGRTIDSGTNRGNMRSAEPGGAGYAPRAVAPSQQVQRAPRTYNPAPVQISPPIVRDRGSVGGGSPRMSAPRSESRGGSFGTARPAQPGGGGNSGRAVQGGGGGNRGGRGR